MKRAIQSARGFHATEKVSGKNCWICHTEHKGREHEVLGWPKIGGRDKFDHNNWTSFKLEGAHANKARCDDCHARKNKEGVRIYLEEPATCAACHKKDSPHGPARAEADHCERCHGVEVWKPVKTKLAFNHNDPQQARYPLIGFHVDVKCEKCHPIAEKNGKKAPTWRVTKDFSDCKACHIQDEPQSHRGMLFEVKRCDWCHGEKKKWKEYSFDHNKRTKFILDGKHNEISCYDCHKAGQKKKPDKACEICHAKDNKHKERFVKEFPSCGTCHDAVRWKPNDIFDHDHLTKFKLTGKHAEASCRACHRGNPKDPSDFERFPVAIVTSKPMQCMACHKHKDVHEHKFTNAQCLNCHKMPGTRTSKETAENKFHGPKSTFPLDGGHTGVPCIKCHPKPTPTADNIWKVSNQCGPACHPDKLHKGTLGNDCLRCHEGGFWKATAFNHDEDTKWPLVGFHRKVICNDCHPKRVYKPTASNCFNCHEKDDAHNGHLGNGCDKCHEPTGKSLFDHNNLAMSRYPLEGKHLKVACGDCHPNENFKPVPIDCYGCHKKDDVHKGSYGTGCERCHTVKSWKTTKPIHDVGAFRLAGAHDHLLCDRCHGPDLRPLAGTGDLCVTCHRQDDIHHNALGPRCGDCHTQWSFAPSTFVHATVGCDLRGVHRVVPCDSCHRGGNFMALTPNCIGCHRKDALVNVKKFGPMDAHAGYTTCTPCHNPNFWLPKTGSPGPMYGISAESVCR